jgi:hypothetical protein
VGSASAGSAGSRGLIRGGEMRKFRKSDGAIARQNPLSGENSPVPGDGQAVRHAC